MAAIIQNAGKLRSPHLVDITYPEPFLSPKRREKQGVVEPRSTRRTRRLNANRPERKLRACFLENLDWMSFNKETRLL